MKKINFVKMHGLGNDFVILDSRYNPDLYDKNNCNLTVKEIQLICHRNFGIGCDQLLLIESSTNKMADFDYRIYNQDGSSATHCGNGARCITMYLLNNGPQRQQIILNLAGHLVYGSLVSNNSIMINMGVPSFTPKSVGYLGTSNKENCYAYSIVNTQVINTKQLVAPASKLIVRNHTSSAIIKKQDYEPLLPTLNKKNKLKEDSDLKHTINFALCSIGNPHVIIKLDNLSQLKDDSMLRNIAQSLQNSGLFKDGININFFVIRNKKIHLRTFERGCGFTLACGTGACATASYAIAKDLVTSPVIINMAGGNVEVHWDKKTQLKMVGNATHVFSGEMLL